MDESGLEGTRGDDRDKETSILVHSRPLLSCSSAPHPSWVEIDIKQFKRNIYVIRRHIGNALFCLPVKANAYGHGLCAIGKAAEEAGVDYLAVAHLQEAVKLRCNGIALPILVLGAIHEEQIPDLIDFDFEFTISSKFKADLVAQRCRKLGRRCRIHIEVDTGMQRTGVRPDTALELFKYIKSLECFEIKGIYSHLATADEPDDSFTLKQIADFILLTSGSLMKGTPLIRHLSNSGGTIHYPEAHLDMVRPSLIAFGHLPPRYPHSFREIAPCFSLKTKVSYFKVVRGGEGISYGHRYKTVEQTRIVTVPIGYGDGYRRCLSNRGHVLIRGKRFPIVGTICMDQFMVDIGQQEVYVGDEVVLIGKQGNEEITVQEIADHCNTNAHEVLCFFNDRLPRIYS